jgi:hypothetical protein
MTTCVTIVQFVFAQGMSNGTTKHYAIIALCSCITFVIRRHIDIIMTIQTVQAAARRLAPWQHCSG